MDSMETFYGKIILEKIIYTSPEGGVRSTGVNEDGERQEATAYLNSGWREGDPEEEKWITDIKMYWNRS